MQLRKYRTSDCEHLAELFYHTVHSVNEIRYDFLIISLEVLICRYSLYL